MISINIWTLVSNFIHQFLRLQKRKVRFDVFPARKIIYGHLSSNFLLQARSQHQDLDLDLWINQFNQFVQSQRPKWLTKFVIQNGFVNFHITSKTLYQVIDRVLTKQTNYGRGQQKSIIYKLEIVSANPTGFLHVGHIRNGIIGDSVGRILEFSGYRVIRQYYLNDTGQQIINLAQTVIFYYNQICEVKLISQWSPDFYQGPIYQTIAQQIYDQDGNKHAYPRTPVGTQAKVIFFAQKAVTFFLNIIRHNLDQIKIKIDEWLSEKWIIDNPKTGLQLVLDQLKTKKLTFNKDGALWLQTTKFGDDKDRVLIKSNGDYTYFLPDLVAHWLKFKSTPTGYQTKVLDFWGADHHSYVQRVKIGLSQLSEVKINNFEVILSSIVLLVQNGQMVKLSKRKGTGIWFNELFSQLGSDLMRFIFCSQPGANQLKINVHQLTTNSIQNPFFYWQYAVVRCHSLFLKAKQNPRLNQIWPTVKVNLKAPLAIKLVIKIHQFNWILQEAATVKSPHIICDYGHQLATLLHEYYTQEKIIDSHELETSGQRLKLIRAVWYLLTISLSLLGIKPKTKM